MGLCGGICTNPWNETLTFVVDFCHQHCGCDSPIGSDEIPIPNVDSTFYVVAPCVVCIRVVDVVVGLPGWQTGVSFF